MGKVEMHSEAIKNRFKIAPFKHQLECLNQKGRNRYFALLAEMGTGKTHIIINNMADLWSSNDCDAVLIFAPNGVHTNWTRLEIPKTMPDWVRYRAEAWTSSTSKKELARMERLYEDPHSGELRIFTMNWEALQSKRGFEAAERFVSIFRRAMIVCDESDSIKNPSAVRTKNLMKLKKYSYWRRIMSGTPVNNAPFDLFSQFLFLDEHILETHSHYAFKAEYAEMLHDGHPLLEAIKTKNDLHRSPQIIATNADGSKRYRNLDKLSRLIAPHSFRVLKKDCVDLPEKIYKTLVFDLTPEQEKIYKKAKDECRLVFEQNETPFNKLVSITKLAQITSGYYIHPMSEQPVRIEGENPKLDMLVERVSKIVESGEKVIVWARYKIEIQDIVKRLKEAEINCVEYHGEISKKDRETAIDEFQHGKTQVFVGNQQAGGVGITLTAASYMIYFSNTFSLRDRLQSEDRAHRIGQTKNVVYINIVAKGTIDEYVVKALDAKEDVADKIVNKGLELFK